MNWKIFCKILGEKIKKFRYNSRIYLAPLWWSSAVATDPLAVTFIDFILLGNQAKNAAAAATAAAAPQLRLALESHFFFLFGLAGWQWQAIAVAYSKLWLGEN